MAHCSNYVRVGVLSLSLYMFVSLCLCLSLYRSGFLSVLSLSLRVGLSPSLCLCQVAICCLFSLCISVCVPVHFCGAVVSAKGAFCFVGWPDVCYYTFVLLNKKGVGRSRANWGDDANEFKPER